MKAQILALSLRKIGKNIIIYAGIVGIVFSRFNLNELAPSVL